MNYLKIIINRLLIKYFFYYYYRHYYLYKTKSIIFIILPITKVFSLSKNKF